MKTGKEPGMYWYSKDWLTDEAVTLCADATRGIWVDWLSVMSLSRHAGTLSGTVEELAKLGRTKPDAALAALMDLSNREAAVVTFSGSVTDCHTVVTLINRRRQREDRQRLADAERQRKHRCHSEIHALPSASALASASATAQRTDQISPPTPITPAPETTSAGAPVLDGMKPLIDLIRSVKTLDNDLSRISEARWYNELVAYKTALPPDALTKIVRQFVADMENAQERFSMPTASLRKRLSIASRDPSQQPTELTPSEQSYLRQARNIIDHERGQDIGRFWAKVKDALGANSLLRIKTVLKTTTKGPQ